jgi:hypothetical protein
MLNFTSGGIDNGARPICDARGEEEENWRVEVTGNAGSRKAGIETDGVVAEAIALSRPLERAVESIVCWSMGSEMSFIARCINFLGACGRLVWSRERQPRQSSGLSIFCLIQTPTTRIFGWKLVLVIEYCIS